MSQSDLMFELSHPARIGLIRLAAAGPVRHRDMMQASGLPPSEVTRHVRRLMDIGFLRKNRDGHFEITHLGGILLDRVADFEFISFHGHYFERHEVSGIPPGFDLFGMLRRCQVLDGTMAAVNAILRINAESRSYVHCMLDEFNDALVSVQAEKLRTGLDISIMTRSASRIPSEYSETRMMGIDLRTMATIPIFLMASDRESLICLKRGNGRVDYSTAFRSSEPEFLDWCGTLFEHYWTRGRAVRL